MPKLLIVSTVYVTIRAFLLPYARYFCNKGWIVHGMANGVNTCPLCIEAFDKVWHVPFSRFPLNKSNFIEAPRMLLETIINEKYDIIHVHTPVAAFLVRCTLASLPFDLRPTLIYTAHGYHFHTNGRFIHNSVYLLLEKLAARWTDYTIVINRDDYFASLRHNIMPADKLLYAPGIGVDLSHYDPARVSEEDVGNIRKSLALSSADHLFVMIAAFDPMKRHCDIIRALSLIGRPCFHVAFAGNDGPTTQEARNLANKLGLAQNIHFLGYRTDIPALIKAATAVLLPSEREGLPRCLLESMAMCVPFVASRIKGIVDLAEHGCGILHEVGDTRAIASAMQWVADHPHDAGIMGTRGGAASRKYEISKLIDFHEALYNRIIDQRT